MKAKHLPLLVALAGVAAAAWYFVARRPKATPAAATGVWRKATPVVSGWQKEYVDTQKTSVEYKEQGGVLYVRGTIATRNYEGAGSNGILAGKIPLTYALSTRQPQSFAPYFRAEEQDGDTMLGCVEFPATLSFSASSAAATPLTYANLKVSAGAPGQLTLSFVHHGSHNGCATFTFSKG